MGQVKAACQRCSHWPHDEAVDPRCPMCGCVNVGRVIQRMMSAESELAAVGSAEGLWHTGGHEECGTCEQWRRTHDDAGRRVVTL